MEHINQRLNREDPHADILSQPLVAGDFVMYSASTSGRLAIAEVVEITKKKIRVRIPGGSYSWVGGPDRFVKVSLNA